MEYPKISPAVIIAVTDGNRILMSKYAGREYKKYALWQDSTRSERDHRGDGKREKSRKRSAFRLRILPIIRASPGLFPIRCLGFFHEMDGEDKITLDQEELALAQWFEREDIPVKEDDLSLTNEMMIAFKNGRK